MRKTEQVKSWVVYRMSLHNNPEGMNAVCEEAEWEAIEQKRPGLHALVRSGITNEGEAERLARGTSGDAKGRGQRRLAEEAATQLGYTVVSAPPMQPEPVALGVE